MARVFNGERTLFAPVLRPIERLLYRLFGVDEEKVAEVVQVIRDNCRERSRYLTPMPPMVEPGEFFVPYPVEVQVGGATVWVLPVESFEKL